VNGSAAGTENWQIEPEKESALHTDLVLTLCQILCDHREDTAGSYPYYKQPPICLINTSS
jgi:hypothetical protein